MLLFFILDMFNKRFNEKTCMKLYNEADIL
jgi:hypothetical protein